MLIVEIILCIVAATWRGWKWLAAIPLAVPFVLGIVTAAGNGDIGTAGLFDVIAIIILIVMCIVPKTSVIRG